MKRKINFNDLPCDIKRKIFIINNKDKHKKLLNKCFKEIEEINHNLIEYMDWVIYCVGISVWEHDDDFEYWLNLENSREKEKRKYYMKIKNICKILIKKFEISNINY